MTYYGEHILTFDNMNEPIPDDAKHLYDAGKEVKMQ